MIKITAVEPAIRRSAIEKGVKELHGANDEAFLKEWGVSVDNKMVEIQARVLPNPKMTFYPKSSQGEVMEVRDGQWTIGRGGLFMARPGVMNKWSVAVFGSERDVSKDKVYAFIEGLVKMLVQNKIVVGNVDNLSNLIVYQGQRSPEATLDEAAKLASSPVDMIFCIIQSSGSIYSDVKKYCETVLGVMSQCMVIKHARDDVGRKMPYFGNIMLKINTKLGGLNCFLEPKVELPAISAANVPTMIIGADVSHGGTSEGAKSIAAVVGSIDNKFCEYRATARVQEGKLEMIQDFGGCVQELFDQFKAKNKRYPERVVDVAMLLLYNIPDHTGFLEQFFMLISYGNIIEISLNM